MARKGRKTRWRKLPIPIGSNQGEASCAANHVTNNLEPEHLHQHPSSPSPKEQVSRVTFNEDEYTKITTPRQDMLFKKGYLSKKRPQAQEQQQLSYNKPEPSQSPSDSVESEQYVGCDEPPFPAPFVYPTGYMDPNGLFYLNGGGYEVYDPYSNSVTVIVGPGTGYPGQPVLTAVPCHPVPLQPIEWFNPSQQHQNSNFKKRNSTDSQNWGSSQSCESPSSGQEVEAPDSSLFYPQPQYIYPGYMFGAPMYNINGVGVQGAGVVPPQHHVPQHTSSQHQPTQHQPQPADQPKRRKKRRKRRRPGMGDEGSESSCEEVAGSGVSSDTGQGSSCSKTTDSGIHTGADSPQPQSSPVLAHDSPPPDVSTEEEPSQPSISQIPCLNQTSHLATDSSTEDEANQQLHDTSLDELIVKTEELCNNHNENISPESEKAIKEEIKENKDSPIINEINIVNEIPIIKEVPVINDNLIINEIAIVDEIPQSLKVKDLPVEIKSTENEIELEALPKIKREESDEWVNAKENGSEYEEENITEFQNTVEVTWSTPEKNSSVESTCIFEKVPPPFSDEMSCDSSEKIKHFPLIEAPVISIEEHTNLTSENVSIISPEDVSSASPEEIVCITPKEAQYFSVEEASCFLPICSEDNQSFLDEKLLSDYKEDIEECIAEETGYSEEGWGSAEETSVEHRCPIKKKKKKVTVDKPITEAVTRWLESQGTKALVPHPPIESEDEGIGEETSSPTGPKNVKGNPFLVRYPSTGTRVADMSICESEMCAWRAKCDPMVSVDRYYRLGADLPSTSPTFKTATAHPTIMHIDPSLPFPCGLVCCILQ